MAFTHSFRYRRWYTGCAVLLLLALGLAPGQAARAVPAPAPERLGTYNNPAERADSTGGRVESCADPSIIHGQTARRHDWYIYCTTDPLNGQDRDPGGDFNFHLIPMLRSLRPGQLDLHGRCLQPPARAGSTATPACGRPNRLLQRPVLPLLHRVRHQPAGRRQRHRRRDQRQPRWARGPTAARRWSSRTTRPAAPARRRWVFDPDVIDSRRPELHLLRQLLRRHLGAHAIGRRPALRPGQPDADHHRQPLRGRQHRPARRLLLPVRLGHQLLQRPADRLQRLRRALAEPARPVRRPRGRLAAGRARSAARRCSA